MNVARDDLAIICREGRQALHLLRDRGLSVGMTRANPCCSPDGEDAADVSVLCEPSRAAIEERTTCLDQSSLV